MALAFKHISQNAVKYYEKNYKIECFELTK